MKNEWRFPSTTWRKRRHSYLLKVISKGSSDRISSTGHGDKEVNTRNKEEKCGRQAACKAAIWNSKHIGKLLNICVSFEFITAWQIWHVMPRSSAHRNQYFGGACNPNLSTCLTGILWHVTPCILRSKYQFFQRSNNHHFKDVRS